MAIRSIARLYDTSASAHAAVAALEAAGFAQGDISYMGPERDRVVEANRGDTGAAPGAATGATFGTLLGGGAGLLAGLGALAIPGVGPVVAAGWLVATLTGAGAGAAAGGLLGGLVSAGFGEEEAGTYSEGLRRGGHLVVVRAPERRADEAERILDGHGPVDMHRRTEDWRREGWAGGAGNVSSGTVGGPMPASYRGGVDTTGLGDSLPGANDPRRGKRGDVA
ncbi:hypothetical protein [Falsiroseomonas bella]|uniref:hypothetical protein n=1 Tax=Falsiroseomonas bella TaxID=2184016 RepID=UPI0018EEB379|nr:hypothetical protein [Falsiroseomonas bella]